MSQRLALLAVVAAGAGLAAAVAPAVAKPPVVAATATSTTAAQPSKKDTYLQGKAPTTAAALVAPGAAARPVINLQNTWTDEWLALDASGKVALAPDEFDRFLRDHFTGEPTTMDPRLIAVLRDAARHFKADRVEIVSGYRAPKYNLMLRKKGHEVARDSQHTHGNAVDFRIPGVSTEALHAWAVSRKLGGVGIYRRSQFVHMDTGRVRYWSGD
ncbi:MAG: DUF882 domain-containing protein [Kofleriaceae bacterium]